MERNIYVIGDIHGDLDLLDIKFEELKSKSKTSLEKKDILFVAGDAGFVNSYENETSKGQRMKHLNNLPFIIIAVLGNHENYDIIESFPEEIIFNGKCYKEPDVDVYYAKNGQIFDIDGIKFFTFNGGLSIDKDKRLKLEAEYNKKFWWPQEIKTEDFQSAYQYYCTHHVDYVITHDVPLSIFNKLIAFIPGRFKDQICPLQDFLQKIYNANNFKHWYAGHYHPSYPVTVNDNITVLPIGYITKIIGE